MSLNLQLSTLDFLRRHWRLALPIGSVAVAFLVIFPYYAWKAAIARQVRGELERGALQSEISNLKSQAAEAEKRAATAETQSKELAERIQKSEVRSQKLAGELTAAVEREKKARVEIAQLSGLEVAVEVEKEIGPSDQRVIGPSEDQGRKVLEIIADRDGCLELSTLNSQLLQNCEDRNSIFDVQRSELLSQVGNLKQALDLNKRAFDKRDDLAKKQVRAAKGSWLGRALGKAKWFAVGVGAGAVAGAVAAR